METRKIVRFKMYKAGKKWMFAGITTLSLGLGIEGASQSVHADETTIDQASTTFEPSESSSDSVGFKIVTSGDINTSDAAAETTNDATDVTNVTTSSAAVSQTDSVASSDADTTSIADSSMGSPTATSSAMTSEDKPVTDSTATSDTATSDAIENETTTSKDTAVDSVNQIAQSQASPTTSAATSNNDSSAVQSSQASQAISSAANTDNRTSVINEKNYVKVRDDTQAENAITVNTAQQLSDAISKGTYNTVYIANNIDMSDLSGWKGITISNSRSIMITSLAGKRYTLDMDSYYFTDKGNGIITIQNLNMFGRSYYGMIRNAKEYHFNNVIYTGSQFVYSPNADIYMHNNVTVTTVAQYSNGIAGHDQLKMTQDSSVNRGNNQQVIQGASVIFTTGSHFIATTSNGNVLQLTNGGKGAVLEAGATVDLYPHTNANGTGEGVQNGASYAILTDGNVTLGKGAKLNIYLNVDPSDAGASGAIALGSGATVTAAANAKINIVANGKLLAEPIYFNGANAAIIIGSGASFNFQGNNLGDSTKSIFSITKNNANFTIKKDASFNVAIDGTGAIAIFNISGGGQFTVTNPKEFLIDQSKNTNTGSTIINNASLTFNDVRVKDGDGYTNAIKKLTLTFSNGKVTVASVEGKTQDTENRVKELLNNQSINILHLISAGEDVAIDNVRLNGTSLTGSLANGLTGAYINVGIKHKDGTIDNLGTINQLTSPYWKDDKYYAAITKENGQFVIDLSGISLGDGDSITLYAVKDFLEDIEDYNVSELRLANKKILGKEALVAYGEQAKNKIDTTMPGLTTAEKEQYKSDIDNEVTKESVAIDAATTQNDVDTLTDQSKLTIDGYTSAAGNQSAAKIQQAKQAIIDAVNQTKTKIDNDKTLTVTEKQTQKANVDKAANTANTAIDAATGANGIDSAVATGKINIANIHQPGTSVTDQKNTAKENIQAIVDQIKHEIDNDTTLTTTEKNKQKANVDKVASAANTAIDVAKGADNINQMIVDGKTEIANQHQMGTAVADQKDAAKEALQAVANQTKLDIDNDKTLTTAEKSAQKSNVDKAVSAANKAIDTSTDADGINQAVSEGKADIANQHQIGTTVADQKDVAKEALQAVANQTKLDIDNDKTLTIAEKSEQKADVDKAVSAANAAIDAATNADGINQCVADGKTAITNVHQSGHPTDDQKDAAKETIQAAATKVKQAIDNDKTLTTAEKSAQKSNVDKAVSAANAAIDAATNADGINESVSDGKIAIENAHQVGQATDDQKDVAKEAIQATAKKVKQAIDNDKTLTTAEKNAQKSNIDKAVGVANEAINAATNADDITQAVADGKTDITNQHQTGTAVADQKDAAKEALQAVANQTKLDIDNDKTLTTAEKSAQKSNVDKAVSAANAAIEVATDADDINQAVADGQTAIANAHQAGQATDDQKDVAKEAIQATANEVKQSIDNDKTLTTVEKSEQKANVDKAVSAANEAIEVATDADDINQAVADGKTDIINQHQISTVVADQKDVAKEALQVAANQTKLDIDNDKTLTTAEKSEQKADVDKAVSAANEAIDAATNADDINQAVADGKTDITNQHQTGTAVADQKEAAKITIQATANQIKQAIDNDKTLTTSEKNEQKANVDKAVSVANAAIDKATNADDINQSVADGKIEIENAHQVGHPTDGQKDIAKEEIQVAANKAKQAIDSDRTLTTVEKNAQKVNVDKAVSVANAAIDAATDADDINQAVSEGKANIVNQHQSSTAVADQKDAAKEALQAAANQTKLDIDNDKTLTTAEKSEQKANVDKAVSAANKAIDTSTDADGINQAVSEGKADIANQHQSSTAVADQKDAAKEVLQAVANQTKLDIDNDKTLTTAEKSEQKADVDKAVSAANEAIDAATGADGINQAVSVGQTAIVNAHQAGHPTDDQKDVAKEVIQAAANEAKQAIDNDKTLTTAEKDKQKANVDKAVSVANAAIDAATGADGINQAVSVGQTAIANAHQVGHPTDDQKDVAKETIQAAAKEVKQAIDNDKTLTTAEKDKQKANVDKAVSVANAAIDKATDADEINQAVANGKTVITNAHQAGFSTDDQKDAAKEAIQATANQIKQAIDNDKTLTRAEKNAQKANVDKAVSAANAAIDAATNADDINQAVADGEISIANAHQAGRSTDDQKDSAKAELQAVANQTKLDIENDVTLTTAEKNQQKANVDKAVSVANAAIDVATNADEIKQAVSDGKPNIANQHQMGTTVADQKDAAKGTIQATASQIKQAIDNDKTLTTAEKDAQKANVDKAVIAVNAVIDVATNADDINQSVADGQTAIANAHQVGQPTDDQKDVANAAIQAVANEVKQAIDNDKTLTTAEKNAQKVDVDKAVSAANAAINKATDADGINQAVNEGKANIANQHQSSTAVADQKNAAKEAIQAAANEVKQAIDNDKTLTAAEKDAQKSKADKAVSVANAAIDAATNADYINQAVADGQTAITNAHQVGHPTDKQKDAAKGALQAAANQTKLDIDNDATLTTTEKEQQKQKVDEAENAANAAIDAATNADDINQAVSDGKTAIANAHQAGQATDDQKDVAKEAIQTAANEVKQAIDKDKTLTTAEKNAQKANVDKAVSAANAAIDKVADADSINQAVAGGKISIANAHQVGQATNDQKNAANATIQAEANKIKQEIDNDVTLTTVEKDQQKADVDRAVSAANKVIDAATDADEINQAVSDGQTAIVHQHQSGTAVAEQKNAANAAIQAEANKIKQAIDNDKTLTTAEKNAQKVNVDKAVNAANKAIGAATNADGIKQAVANSQIEVANQHQVGTTVAEQKAAAKEAIQAAANEAKQAIDNDKTLTTAEKNAQKADVDKAVSAANEAIDKGTDADEINQAVSDGKTAIMNAHQTGHPTDDQKDVAKEAIQAAATEVKQAIDNDKTLTTAEKNSQKANVDKAVSAANAAIDKATNADDIRQSVDDGKTAITNAYQAGHPTDNQKDAAKGALQAAANKTKLDIDNDVTLTTVEKEQQKKKVDKAISAANEAIDEATNADDINQSVDDGKMAITNAHQVGQATDDQKDVAKEAIQAAANEVKQAIDNDKTLTTAEKNEQKANVDKAVSVANAAIDEATDADEINQATVDGQTEISNQHQSGTAVAEQKDAAKTTIQAVANQVKQVIDNDKTLTTDEKNEQKQNVDKAVSAANTAIDKATDADGINQALANGQTVIAKAHQSGRAVDRQKNDAKAAIKVIASQIKQVIDNDKTLTTAEKNAQMANVDKVVRAVNAAIDAATDANGINKAVSDGNLAIANAHQSGKSTDDQKDAAKAEIQAAANEVKQAIDNDKTLTAAQKSEQKANVDKAVSAVNIVIDASDSADYINATVATGEEDIANQHKHGVTLGDQMNAAKEAIQAAANRTKLAIDNDVTLTTAEKNKQKANVDKIANDANATIDVADNADDINQAVVVGNVSIAKQHQVGMSINKQKALAKDKIQATANETKLAIDNDPTLTAEQKQAQKAAVDQEVLLANQRIDRAQTADDIQQVTIAGVNAVKAQHKAGQNVDNQKDQAKVDIIAEGNKIKHDIDKDASLTASERAKQKHAVDVAVQHALQAIDEAKTADEVNKILSEGKEKIDKQHVPGTNYGHVTESNPYQHADTSAKTVIHVTEDEKQPSSSATDHNKKAHKSDNVKLPNTGVQTTDEKHGTTAMLVVLLASLLGTIGVKGKRRDNKN
ncbi:FmtB protein [Weissella jogaejeotgali]|uniref:FmtB protein n=1 Tax=Weissella jogaejeotgali TaxID=1631871 RepID=A0A1L6R9G9_9LACO|nr:DUF1542 domain-containing protein [Weissella jogaejeotgali]APS41199.1 FmtB protein [Weissella jogaejeotgali]